MDIALLKREAEGRWAEIVGALCPEIEHAIETRKHVRCPIHGGVHGDGFRVFRNFDLTGGTVCNTCGVFTDGIATIRFLKGVGFKEAMQMVRQYIGGQRTKTVVPARPLHVAPKEADIQMRKEILNKIWRESAPIREGDPGYRYLSNRGLNPEILLPINDIRLHPSLTYYEDGKAIGQYPTLVGIIRGSDGKARTLQRIYLTAEGQKAPVAAVKKLMPPVGILTGGAIRLYAPQDKGVIGIAEGIETALAVRQMTGIPCWAATNAQLLARFEAPEGITRVHIYIDRDPATAQHPKGHGYEAGAELLQRLWQKGIKCSIISPREKDFLLDLIGKGNPNETDKLLHGVSG